MKLEGFTFIFRDCNTRTQTDLDGEGHTLTEVISAFRGFLRSAGYGEEHINRFVLDPCAEYSTLTPEQQWSMQLAIVLEEECDCDECTCGNFDVDKVEKSLMEAIKDTNARCGITLS